MVHLQTTRCPIHSFVALARSAGGTAECGETRHMSASDGCVSHLARTCPARKRVLGRFLGVRSTLCPSARQERPPARLNTPFRRSPGRAMCTRPALGRCGTSRGEIGEPGLAGGLSRRPLPRLRGKKGMNAPNPRVERERRPIRMKGLRAFVSLSTPKYAPSPIFFGERPSGPTCRGATGAVRRAAGVSQRR